MSHQLPGFYGLFPGLSRAQLWERTEAHIDALFGYWVNAVKIPQLRTIGPYPHLQAIAVSEDVVLFLGLAALILTSESRVA